LDVPRRIGQGSIDQVSYAGGDSSSTRVKKFSFGAYGKRRNTDWTNDTSNARFDDDHWIERGYTGHEHLDNVRLIHMNGRVQDPIFGRWSRVDHSARISLETQSGCRTRRP
jgi:hypothetical protein